MQIQRKITRFLRGSMIAVGIVCVIVFSVLGVYMSVRSNHLIDEVGSMYMKGMNERISSHFSTMVNSRLKQMETIVETIPATFENEAAAIAEGENDGSQQTEIAGIIEDSDALRNWLVDNGNFREFEAIAYYYEDGTFEMIYGEACRPVNPDSFRESLSKDVETSITIGEEEDDTGAIRQSALIGTPCKIRVMKDGTEKMTVAVVGKISIEDISTTLSLDQDENNEFTSLIYSFVIRKEDGSFVIRSADVTRDNYFERVDALYEEVEGKGKGKDSVEQYKTELKAAMAKDETYGALFTFKESNVHCQVYCSKLPASEWYLLTFLPYGPLDEMVNGEGVVTLLLSVGSCLLILLTLFFIFMAYIKLNHRQFLEVEEARQTAESASKSKSEFLSNMSHDIRTPMNAIVGMTAIALANIDDKARVENCLKKITLSSKHLLGLINDVLDMSKIESGKMTLSVEQVSLRDTMEGIVSIVQPQIKAKKQRFDIFIYDITSENVLCDSVRLNQILLNLLSNAIKFTPEGGAIEVSLHEQVSPKGDDYVRILLRVKDTGIGMSEEFRARIFESFTREDNKRVQKTEGTGLGMAITKYIVDAMGGEIRVDSEQGVGTEFNVTLDFKRTDKKEEDMILPDFTMLVVDDDKQLCESTAASLKSIGVRADWTLDGESAIQIVRQHHELHNDYHIILLDLKLPGIDGIRTAKELRKQLGEDVPILLISAYDYSEFEEEAREAGINGFLSKPLFKSTLYYGLKPYINEAEKPSEPNKKEVNFVGKRVLLAEDNDLNWEIASELLQELGLELERAENGEICANMFQKSPIGYYDAVLMDIRMPVKDGYEATDLIRGMARADSNLPIIAMTADAFSEDIQRCMEHGMNAHVAKPIDMKELTRILSRYFE